MEKEAACKIADNLVADSCILLDCNKMPVNTHATAHVFQHSPEISPHISAECDEHRDWAIIRDSLVKGAAEAAKYGIPSRMRLLM